MCKLNLKTKNIDINSLTFKNVVLIHKDDAIKLNLKSHNKLLIEYENKKISAVVETTNTMIKPGQIGLYQSIHENLKIPDDTFVKVSIAPGLDSIKYIQNKIYTKKPYTREQLDAILRDIYEQNLSPLEISVFLMAQEYIPMTDDEIENMTRGMAELGEIIDWGNEIVYTKHSIGGVPGNKVSLLIVPIVASAGLLIPKISTRAITSPAGTADTMEIFAPIEFNAEEIKEMALKVKGTICWGGKLDLSPADSIIASVESILNLDPTSQIIASILSKQLALGVNKMVLDLPIGSHAKVKTRNEARKLSFKFIEIASRLNICLECGITYGGQPIGYNVGPALEAREALETLMGHGPNSLIEKSVELAGILLELGGKSKRGSGYQDAENILKSGRALEKFREIIETQGGNREVKPSDIQPGKYTYDYLAYDDGYVKNISNKLITEIARASGAPKSKGAGIKLFVKEGHKVSKNSKLLRIYAEKEEKLSDAIKILEKEKPIYIESMLLDRIGR